MNEKVRVLIKARWRQTAEFQRFGIQSDSSQDKRFMV